MWAWDAHGTLDALADQHGVLSVLHPHSLFSCDLVTEQVLTLSRVSSFLLCLPFCHHRGSWWVLFSGQLESLALCLLEISLHSAGMPGCDPEISPHGIGMPGCGPKMLKEIINSLGWRLAFPGLKSHPCFFQHCLCGRTAPSGCLPLFYQGICDGDEGPLRQSSCVIPNLVISAKIPFPNRKQNAGIRTLDFFGCPVSTLL